MPDETTGIRAFDLAGLCPLPPSLSQFWHAPTAAEAAVARHRERERQAAIRQAADEALADWQRLAETLAGNLVALAGLGCHRPVAGYFGVECTECCDRYVEETQAAEWPCATYAAMKAAADG